MTVAGDPACSTVSGLQEIGAAGADEESFPVRRTVSDSSGCVPVLRTCLSPMRAPFLMTCTVPWHVRA